MSTFWNYVTANYEQILNLLGKHLYLSVFSVLIAIIIGIPLGILISRTKTFKADYRSDKCNSGNSKFGFAWFSHSIYRDWKYASDCDGSSLLASSNCEEYLHRVDKH